jgi:dihydrodiol dehydrogenase / D-xylose 1-dehydrogenase (NADP)
MLSKLFSYSFTAAFAASDLSRRSGSCYHSEGICRNLPARARLSATMCSDMEIVPDAVSLVSPLDDASVRGSELLSSAPSLKWGIVGCGRVCHDFVQALKAIPTAQVVACATASDLSRAQEFASRHKIPNAYGSYAQMLAESPEIEVCYVGNIHCYRRETGELCLMANKHVLLEKPFACCYEDAQYLIQLARDRNLFIMEGMWTRFFPAVEHARQITMRGSDNGYASIGHIVNVQSDFHFNAADSEEYPTSFVYNHALGGGATFLVGPYAVAAASLFFPPVTSSSSVPPLLLHATGQVDELTGVDLQAAVSLSFPPSSMTSPAVNALAAEAAAAAQPKNGDHHKQENEIEKTPKLPGAGVASLSFGMLGESAEETMVVGTKGRLLIETPCHCPLAITIRYKGAGRGGVAQKPVRLLYPLPEVTVEMEEAGGFEYPNSIGFCYEAAAVARCIKAGRLEAPQYTHQETLFAVRCLEEIRKQLGVKPLPR